MIDPLFEKYILSRGLIEPNTDFRKVVFEDKELLSAAAGIYRGSKHIIEAVIRARIGVIEHELVTEAEPYEVLFLRQAMVEVAMIFDDFEKYAAEYERHTKELPPPAEGSPPPVVGALEAPNAEDNGSETSM